MNSKKIGRKRKIRANELEDAYQYENVKSNRYFKSPEINHTQCKQCTEQQAIE